MHILIDVQGYQSESKFRGIGRSTLAMSRALIRNAGEHRVSILINGMYPVESVNSVKHAYRDILPDDEMFIFSAASPTAYCHAANHPRSYAAEAARDIAIANIGPDIVYVISFFEGHGDNFTVSIPRDPVPWKTVCVCHDLIPLLNKERYLGDPNFRDFYMDKLAAYEQSDAVFAISESAVREIVEYTGIPREKIVNISSAVGDEFRINTYSADTVAALRERFSLPQTFILSLAMIEPRKNIEALIHAYSQLPASLQHTYPLVLAYKVSPEDLERIRVLAEGVGLSRTQLIFTGFLSDSDLIALYNLCTLFVFPSLHEGFGLPPLEAMRCGAATLSSNVTSLPEVIGWDEAMFDPRDTKDICRVMQRALTDSDFFNALKRHAVSQAARFSWDTTAKLALAGFRHLTDTEGETGLTCTEVADNRFVSLQQIAGLSETDYLLLAWSVARNRFKDHRRKLLLDISVLEKHDARTGIQRVSRSILSELLAAGVQGYDVSAVYYTPGECYRYANRFLDTHFGGQRGDDTPVLFTKGDILVVTDLTAHLFPDINPQLDLLRKAGASACFVVHDILPLRRPEWSIEGIQREFPVWLSSLTAHADQLICVSASVADDVRQWITENSHWLTPNPLLKISNFHLGADIDSSVPSLGMPAESAVILAKMQENPSFMMVGTLEPRKGHAQVLAAFDALWEEGKDYQLFIVGKQGWNVDDLCEQMRRHPRAGRQLFWLQDISDEFLSELYSHSDALIFASFGEGFGLPLIEAAQKGLPVIIRDIPVFREIAADHACYFSGETPGDLKHALEQWRRLSERGEHPRSENMHWLTWKQSAAFLLDNLPLVRNNHDG